MKILNDSLTAFSASGGIIIMLLALTGFAAILWGSVNLFRRRTLLPRLSMPLLLGAAGLFVAGFAVIVWLHFRIYQLLPLTIPDQLVPWLNSRLSAMNQGGTYGLPLYDQSAPPRYLIPYWIENEKYFFWFLCYSVMAIFAHRRLTQHRLRGALLLLLGIQTTILYFAVNPFSEPLPRFFAEIQPWFTTSDPMRKFGLFMKLYPKMTFYYNAHYMWFHPPLLFLSYSAITIVFAASCLMLFNRDLAVEKLTYDYAKLGFLALTLGMLLGYPWALQAWGPNWWWDPKICSSIMLWAVFSTYLHTRLYANKPLMWYFSSFLGILSFVAMIFTFVASFFFPGEHTFQ